MDKARLPERQPTSPRFFDEMKYHGPRVFRLSDYYLVGADTLWLCRDVRVANRPRVFEQDPVGSHRPPSQSGPEIERPIEPGDESKTILGRSDQEALQ